MISTSKTSLPKMICSILGHRFMRLKQITPHIKEYKCDCCGKEVTTHTNGNVVPLTEDLKVIHQGLEQLVLRRSRKKARRFKATA